MTAKEWLEIIKQAADYNPELTPLIEKYGELLLGEQLSQPSAISTADAPKHKCQYCGAMTSQPDSQCWNNPDNFPAPSQPVSEGVEWNPADIAIKRFRKEYPGLDYAGSTFLSTWTSGYCQALRDNENMIRSQSGNTEDHGFVWTDKLVEDYAKYYRFSSSRINMDDFKKDPSKYTLIKKP